MFYILRHYLIIIYRFIIYIYIWFLKLFFNVNKNITVFQSRPDFSDNPRALSDFLIKNGYSSKYIIYWIVKDVHKYRRENPEVPIRFIQLHNKIGLFNPFAYYVLMTAKYIFSSHEFVLPKNKGNIGQLYITLWHGCGYKDNAFSNENRFFDKALVPGPLFLKTKASFWHTTEEYLIAKGYPRYDWLLHPSEKAKTVMSYFREQSNKIIIWMPTFRNSKVCSGYGEDIITQFPLIANKTEWLNLDSYCKKKNVILLIKLHMSQKQYDIDFNHFTNIFQITNLFFEKKNIQLYEFLSLTDGLISDYSSVAIDYLLINKPIAFALDDFEQYKDVRGFVFENPKEYMPGHHLYTIQHLENYIDDVAKGNDLFSNRRKEIKNLAIFESDNYCKLIADEFLL